MSIIRVSELSGITETTTGSLFYVAHGNGPTYVSKHITKQDLLGQYATTGSNTFYGDQTISGSLHISGTTTLGGSIVPLQPRGATLGTLERPFSEIFVSSGSINIASDIIGDPNTTLTNIGGNILVSAGGMRLIGNASFVAATGSFQYISGSMEQNGDYHQTGDYELLGNKIITGSLLVSGSQTLIGTQILRGDKIVTGSISISGSQTFIGNQSLLGNKSITGSLYLTGSGGVGFINSHRILTDLDSGSFAITGSNVFTSGQTITGSVNITGSINMQGTSQTSFSHTVTNPSNYVLHQFLTSSHHGGTYAFSAHDDSNGKVTVYSNYIVVQGANAITSNIGGDSKLSSGAGAPNPTFAVGFSGSYAQFKITDTGTFTYRGIVQIY